MVTKVELTTCQQTQGSSVVFYSAQACLVGGRVSKRAMVSMVKREKAVE